MGVAYEVPGGEKMKFNSTSKNPRADIKNKLVQYNQTTGLFTNPDRTIAFKTYEDADRYNKSLGGTTQRTPGVKPSETPFQDTLKNIQKKPTGVQYKNSLERAEEERKERLNRAWGINKKNPTPKVRQETMTERIERINYEYGDTTVPKPKHYDNPYIVDHENWKQQPRKFDSQDKTTYPSDRDQKQRMSTWDILVEKARLDPKDPNSKDTKRMVMKQYYNKDQRKWMGDNELKLIGKHKSQLEKPKPIIENPTLSLTPPIWKREEPVSNEPEINIEDVIKEKTRMKPGLNEDLVKLQSDINKNIEYVLGPGKKEEKSESMSEKTNNQEEENIYDR